MSTAPYMTPELVKIVAKTTKFGINVDDFYGSGRGTKCPKPDVKDLAKYGCTSIKQWMNNKRKPILNEFNIEKLKT